MSQAKAQAMGCLAQRGQTALLDTALFKWLLIRPQPHANEQARGHWLRLAHDNGLSDPRWLLNRHAPRFTGIVRICPACLGVPHAWWPGAWNDREHPWCSEHDCWLVDTCARCHRPLRWHGVQLFRCRCGQALSELPAAALTPACRNALAVDGVTPLSVLIWLGALSKHGLRDKPLKRATRQGMADVIDLAERGAAMVSGWPGEFFRALNAHRVQAPGQESLQLLNLALPGLTRRIRKLGDTHWRVRIQATLDAYTAGSIHTRSPIIGRNVQSHEAVNTTVASVARSLRIRTESLSLAIDNLTDDQVKTRHTANGRSRRLMTPEVIQKVHAVLEDRISIKNAARLLGLSAPRIEQLANAKLLIRQAGRLSKRACNTLQRSLMQVCVHGEAPSEAIRFSDTLRFWIPVSRSSEFFEAVLSGELATYSETGANSIHAMLLARERVMAWASARSDQVIEWLSVPDCATRLGIKQEVAYHLVRVGLLHTRQTMINRRVAQVVTMEALQQFERCYESLSKAAMRAGINWRHGVAWACSNNIKFASGPQIDGGRQYFVHIRSLGRNSGRNADHSMTVMK